jgi:hypothetical protein
LLLLLLLLSMQLHVIPSCSGWRPISTPHWDCPGTPINWGRLRDTLACMGTEGQTLPDGALQLLPIIDTIATKLKMEVGNS